MTAIEKKNIVTNIKDGLRAAKSLEIDYIYMSVDDARTVVEALDDEPPAYRPYMGEGWGTHIWKCSKCDKEILDPLGSKFCRKCGAKLIWK